MWLGRERMRGPILELDTETIAYVVTGERPG